MKKYLVVLTVLTVVIPLSAFACPADGKFEPPKQFDPKTAGDLVDPKSLTPIEKRLNAIISATRCICVNSVRSVFRNLRRAGVL